ncbi:unnamed protein product [Nippostrongylus brasiliensis]|uniref:Secreted protein n=1 Tax=Nippostrongylus brasiliensis TaxID=27835 RepID=A0A0N4Y3T8_NIPBR|nr:unnamed protein product [Nippostrongylus brasiliensis]
MVDKESKSIRRMFPAVKSLRKMRQSGRVGARVCVWWWLMVVADEVAVGRPSADHPTGPIETKPPCFNVLLLDEVTDVTLP